MVSGQLEEAAVAQLEAIRAGRSLRSLIDDLKAQQKRLDMG